LRKGEVHVDDENAAAVRNPPCDSNRYRSEPSTTDRSVRRRRCCY
jgi:hypothetical protein